MSKLDTFNNSEVKCKNCNKYYEILDWDEPIKDVGCGGSIKSYTFKCNECSKQEMIDRRKHKELAPSGNPTLATILSHYLLAYSNKNTIDYYDADKITKAGFFYRNERS